MGIALFAPELVLFCAYRQFSEARKLVKELNELQGARGEDEDVRSKTREVSEDPADNAGHSQGSSQPSAVDLEMGGVWFAYPCFQNFR